MKHKHHSYGTSLYSHNCICCIYIFKYKEYHCLQLTVTAMDQIFDNLHDHEGLITKYQLYVFLHYLIQSIKELVMLVEVGKVL